MHTEVLGAKCRPVSTARSAVHLGVEPARPAPRPAASMQAGPQAAGAPACCTLTLTLPRARAPQVILKPDPGNPQELYLGSLQALGIDTRAHDVRAGRLCASGVQGTAVLQRASVALEAVDIAVFDGIAVFLSENGAAEDVDRVRLCGWIAVSRSRWARPGRPCKAAPARAACVAQALRGVRRRRAQVRFVEDNWENPALGAWGLGWEVWMDGAHGPILPQGPGPGCANSARGMLPAPACCHPSIT